MANLVFPERPAGPPPAPVAVERTVRREPLHCIHELLSISIHDVINERRLKLLVADLYRITRRVENETWLRRRILEQTREAWVAAHL